MSLVSRLGTQSSDDNKENLEEDGRERILCSQAAYRKMFKTSTTFSSPN